MDSKAFSILPTWLDFWILSLVPGVMYCRNGQSTEEEMYNNEEAGPAFNEFLDLIGQRVRLKGFDKYTGGLDKKGTYNNLPNLPSIPLHT